MISLYPYQNKIYQQTRQAFLDGKKSPLIVSPCGSGKTVLFSFFTKQVQDKNKRVLILAHRDELLDQISATLTNFNVRHGYIAAGRDYNPSYGVHVGSVFTVVKRLDKIKAPDFVIIDECFPEYVTVDGVKIKDIKIGDVVQTHRGKERVLNKFVKKTDCVIEISFISGKKLICTPNHPISTDKGFIPAFLLTNDRMVYAIIEKHAGGKNALSNLRRFIKQAFMLKERVSFNVFEKNNIEYVQETWRRNNEIQENKRNARPKGSGKSVYEAKSNGLEADHSRRKRSWPNNSRTRASFGTWMGMQCCCKYWAQIALSVVLQARCWKQKINDWNRGGWGFAQRNNTEKPRQKEAGLFGVDRVENIKIHERGDSSRFEELCPEGLVYNIHVNNDNTYFADGFLVHNCHHVIPDSSFGKILKHFPNVPRVGVTATPCRLSGEPLGAMFDHMILGPSVSELISIGKLSPYKIYVPSHINLDSVHMRGGDFARDELVSTLDKPTITGDAIREYKKFADGKRTIVFCVSVEHAKHVSEQFRASGYQALSIDGKVETSVRREIISDFKSGKITILTTCDLISEGFDLPAIECAIMLRPTASLALWIQQSGRALRVMPGKSHAIILDHAGNTERHGLPDDDREWSLDGIVKHATNKQPCLSVRVCPRCFSAQKSGVSSCIYCGQPFPIQSREIEKKDGELVELQKENLRREERKKQGTSKTLEDLIALGRARKYKYPELWAKHVYNARNKESRICETALMKVPSVNKFR